MSSPSVYLAGPIQHVDDNGTTWRDDLKEAHPDSFDWADPLDKYNSATDAKYVPRSEWDQFDDIQNFVTASEIVEDDKKMIDTSDAVLVGWSEAPSCGTPMEVIYTWMMNQLQVHQVDKPIVVWWRDASASDGHISPWMEYHADAVVYSREDALIQLETRLKGTEDNPWDEEDIKQKIESAVEDANRNNRQKTDHKA